MSPSTRPLSTRPRQPGSAPSPAVADAPRSRSAQLRSWLRSRADRLPSPPSWWWPRGAVALALVVVAATVWVVAFSPVLAVRTIEVVGEQQVTDAQVLAAAAVPAGTPLVRLDLGGVADRVRDLDAIADVEVTRVWPDGVRIEVVERRPLAVIRTADGFGVLGSDGVVYRQVQGPLPGLPFLDQVVGEAASDAGAAAALQVALDLPSSLARRVASVTAAAPDSVVLTMRDGATVGWGSPVATARKAQVLLLLLPQRAARYDVSSPETPVTVG